MPTILLVLGTPTISGLLMSAAEKLNSMENYATVDGKDIGPSTEVEAKLCSP